MVFTNQKINQPVIDASPSNITNCPIHLLHNEIDKNKWDKCIESSKNGMVYACSWYLDVVCPNWEALVIGDYETVMPLPVRTKFGVKYLIRPYFTQQLGIFSTNYINTHYLNIFYNYVEKNFCYCSFHLNYANRQELNNTSDMGLTFTLNLNKTYSELNSNYNNNTKRNIKKALKNDIDIFQSLDPEFLFDLYRKHGKYNDGSRFRNVFKNLIKELINRRIALISYAKVSGNIESAVLWVTYKNRVIYLVACNSEIAYQMNLNFLLIDLFVKSNAEKDIIIDFEGSKILGLARFYESFGGKPEYFPYWHFNNMPFPFKFLKK
jgi:hypothetical protein